MTLKVPDYLCHLNIGFCLYLFLSREIVSLPCWALGSTKVKMRSTLLFFKIIRWTVLIRMNMRR